MAVFLLSVNKSAFAPVGDFQPVAFSIEPNFFGFLPIASKLGLATKFSSFWLKEMTDNTLNVIVEINLIVLVVNFIILYCFNKCFNLLWIHIWINTMA